jgi:hypothetical protein
MSNPVNFILSVPVNNENKPDVKEVIIQFESEEVAFRNADESFDHMIEFINQVLKKKFGDEVYVDDTGIEINKRTEEAPDAIYIEATIIGPEATVIGPEATVIGPEATKKRENSAGVENPKRQKTSGFKMVLSVPVEKDEEDDEEDDEDGGEDKSKPLIIEFSSEERGNELVDAFNESTNDVFTEFIDKELKKKWGSNFSIGGTELEIERNAKDNENADASYML